MNKIRLNIIQNLPEIQLDLRRQIQIQMDLLLQSEELLGTL